VTTYTLLSTRSTTTSPLSTNRRNWYTVRFSSTGRKKVVVLGKPDSITLGWRCSTGSLYSVAASGATVALVAFMCVTFIIVLKAGWARV